MNSAEKAFIDARKFERLLKSASDEATAIAYQKQLRDATNQVAKDSQDL